MPSAAVKATLKDFLGRFGLSIHRRSSIDRLMNELARLRVGAPAHTVVELTSLTPEQDFAGADKRLRAEYAKALAALAWYEEQKSFFIATEDYDSPAKQKRIVDSISNFGYCDFADLAGWIFAASLSNHRVIHQRIDEGAALWRAVKASGGPILEVGRAAGGSTTAILGASGDRKVVSIDRGPIYCSITDYIFSRPDVRPRLTLLTQSSREPILENEFGMMFIDGDHSYEGVCHDIAAFWNSLKPFDGKPALAVFHDAAENPITYVEPVKRACDELIAERGVARVVETWGAMLVLEKLADIDQDRWYAKEDRGFWKRFASSSYPVLSPKVIRGRLDANQALPRKAAANFLGDDNLDHSSWTKIGVELERPYPEVDNPVRFVGETATAGPHGIEKSAKLGVARFSFTVFVRPVRMATLRLSILGPQRDRLASAEFELTNNSRIINPQTAAGIEIVDAAFLYGNGFFRCELSVVANNIIPSVTIAVDTLDKSGQLSHPGLPERGFLMNLASVRELL